MFSTDRQWIIPQRLIIIEAPLRGKAQGNFKAARPRAVILRRFRGLTVGAESLRIWHRQLSQTRIRNINRRGITAMDEFLKKEA